jgi:AraC-like DNA-binding protein
VTARRSVDWPVILGDRAPDPVFVAKSARGELAALLSAFDMLLTADQEDAICLRAIELARSHIGLDRAGIFLIDSGTRRMLGTWGTDLCGEIIDERHVMFDLNEGVLDVFRRAEAGEFFTVLDNCPIVVQGKDSSEVAGRGWVACTPIRSARSRFGMMFNDVGLSGAPVDEAKQARAALLCSLLGSALELARSRPARASTSEPSPARHPVVQKALAMLASDAALVGKEIAAALDVSVSRLVRLFKAELGISLVEYRNRLRIARVQVLMDAGEHNLLKVARASGFGSYAQFHRVFRAMHGTAPSSYLRAHKPPTSIILSPYRAPNVRWAAISK